MSVGEDLLLRIGGDSTAAEKAATRAEIAMRRYQTTVMRANAEMQTEQRAAVIQQLQASREMEADFAKRAAAAEAAATKQAEASKKMGKAMLVAGGVIGAGFAMAAKAAVQWETDWTGVTKTINATPAEFAALEGQLRDLAKVLPASQSEIAGVAAAAGQLGVQKSAILSFTKTMIDLGVSTDLSSDQAATGIAQMMNVMQTAPADVGRLGAALVSLGNNGASTEGQILDMSARIAAAGHQAGLSEADVLAFANAAASVGVQAEAGGSALATFFTKLHDAVLNGGVALDQFAATAGMTSEDFVRSYGQDAASAANAFIKGLGGVAAAGKSTTPILEDTHLTGIRMSQTLLSMANAGDLVAESLDNGREAWEKQTALVNEASKRYETTASKIQIAKNNINDAAISIGTDLLPALQHMAEGVASAADGFTSLPDPMRKTIETFGGLTAAVLLGGGAWLKLSASTRTALVTMQAAPGVITKVSTAMKGLGIAAALVGSYFAVGEIKDWTNTLAGTRKTTDGFAADLVRLGGAGKVTGDVLANFGSDLSGINRDLKASSEGFAGFVNKAIGSDFLDRIHDLDSALSDMVASGDTDFAAAAFKRFADEAEAGGTSLEDFKKRFPEYTEALNNAKIAQDILNDSQRDVPKVINGVVTGVHEATDETAKLSVAQTDLASVFGITGDEAIDLEPEILTLATSLGISTGQATALHDATQTLNDQLQAMFDKAFAATQSQDAFQSALNDMATAAQEAKDAGDDFNTSLTGTGDAAIANRTKLEGMVQDILTHTQNLADAGASTDVLTQSITDNRAALEKQLTDLGFNADEVATFTSVLDNVPGLVVTIFANRDVQKSEDDAKKVERAAAKTRGPWEAKFTSDTGKALLETTGLGDKMSTTAHKPYVITPKLATGDVTDKLEMLGGKLDRFVKKDYTATAKMDTTSAKSAFDEVNRWAFADKTIIVHFKPDGLGGLGAPASPGDSGRTGGAETRDDSYGGRTMDAGDSYGGGDSYGSQDRAAGAGTYSVPAGGGMDRAMAAMAQAIGGSGSGGSITVNAQTTNVMPTVSPNSASLFRSLNRSSAFLPDHFDPASILLASRSGNAPR